MSVDTATIAFAHTLADKAGEVIRPFFRQRIEVTDKGLEKGSVFDPVTAADKGAEQAIRAIIERERPDDGILGEEFGEKKSASGRTWVLDPVDGTRAFITGRHEWGSLIALEDNGRAVLGIMDQPVLRERFIGVNGRAELIAGGTSLQLQVRQCGDIAAAVLCATHPDAYFSENERKAFVRVQRKVRMTRFGGDCYLFSVLALGFIDLIIEASFHRWDVAALIPIVEGAGGIITNWEGQSCAAGGRILAAGDPGIHAQAIKLLNL
ncbi:MAG TPA: histidinol-phosphatase [Terriglobia bacterium]|jgi:myo-inositol-1(or 4)-monophosphatase